MTIEPYPDGRWWPNEHRTSARFPLVCRGNVGEVFPNVVTPLTGSILNVPFATGMQQAFLRLGVATRSQLAEFDGHTSAMTANFAGYLYGNVSLARSMAARTPGLTVEVVDRQMFGLTGAPAHRTGRGDRSVVAAVRGTRAIVGALLRPDDRRLEADRDDVARHVAAVAPFSGATSAQLLAAPSTITPLLTRLMASLIVASAHAAMARSLLERLVSRHGGDGLVNELTAGLGTIESARPAFDMWSLSRIDDPGELASGVAAFVAEHGSRGPDEWELASPTWGSDESIVLAAVECLRGGPDRNDPVAACARLAARRRERTRAVRDGLPPTRRRPFDLALRATARYEAQREATKAALVRLLHPARAALAELGRRSPFEHDDFFLLTLAEAGESVADPARFGDVVAERRDRRDFLQARVPPFWFEGAIPPPPEWELRSGTGRPDPTPRTLTGLGVCSGVATGRARIVTSAADPGVLAPGEVLVAPITDPAWTPLFLAAVAVVVDVGAHMSHAAIVARELGIPAVMSVAGASATIPEGSIVTVDGGEGTVVVHPAPAGGRTPGASQLRTGIA